MSEEIINYDVYLTKMSKTFFDKAWFMCHLPEEIENIVDFGCADGSFMEFLKRNCPSYNYIGIDNNKKFIEMTKQKGFLCYESLNELTVDATKTCLVLNSVIHEICSYGFIVEFLSQLKKIPFKYIAIRDMMYNPIDATKFYLPNDDANKIIKIFKKEYKDQWNEFHNEWKLIQNNEYQITHFLLKYLYNNENWSREVHENYLPININQIHNKINDLKYKIEFQNFYKLPYLVNRWKSDFETDKNFELNEFIRNINTHYKMLLIKY